MHTSTLSVSEIARDVSYYVSRAADGRERFILMDRGQPVAELRPLPSGLLVDGLEDTLRSLPALSAAEAADFEADIEAARTNLSRKKKSS